MGVSAIIFPFPLLRWRLIVSCCQYYWQHRPESMLQVIEEIRANENCIRPYLTDEPPTLETTAIPVRPHPFIFKAL